MREIKFRAWDRNNKIMLDVFGIDYWMPQEENEKNGIRSVKTYEGELGNFALMQYTGLKDKNGKEIYEDDIIKETMGVGKVVFRSGAFGLDYGIRITPLCINDMSSWEAIGNVWENPELLKP
jgi:uncharacterized phage protein (TIGR01671 family)